MREYARLTTGQKHDTVLLRVEFRSHNAITIPVLIAGQSNTRGIQWWFISALTLAAVTPVVIVGLLLERYITRGLTSGALAGQ